MTDPILLVIDALAIFRLSRLITTDSLLDASRNWLLRRWPGTDTEFYETAMREVRTELTRLSGSVPPVWIAAKPHWFGTWVECVWCVSVAVAVGVVAARQWWDWWQWPALVAAGSAAAGWIHSRSQ